ncbi:hypothetical protein [Photobacterium sp. J15]|uniref:hypothetical protein n=1 Tax=Photobacterium sp. J15 TaxID=265901 RepID=UPI0007E45DBB|nr:hypothetical protein [Photobacterium sp. J15]
MNRLVNGFVLVAGIALSGMAAASSLPAVDGKWQCVPEQEKNHEQSWVTYDFKPDGTMSSQEWVRYEENDQTQLEFNLFIDYRYVAKDDDYMLKPVKLSREIITDPSNANPFDYATRRDLTGYRIFFKPVFQGKNEALFDMWYHIDPDTHFKMNCKRQLTLASLK